MDEIIKLQEKIQECKTRLKALQVSQSNYSALSAIKLYFKDIQEFLNLINNNYSSHIEECNSHTILIADLQDQILAINQTLQNLPDSEDIDLSSITSSIQTLTNNLEILQQELTDYKEENEVNFNLISTDISTIQTELAILNEKSFDMEEEVTSINNSIGAINTNISNLTTAQNNLTSTQNNLSSTVSGIDNRLSTAESNISALTGGIDVGELDNRIGELELKTYGDYYSFKDYNYGFTPTNKTLYTREYYFSLTKNKPCKEILTLNYQSTGEGTLTIELYKNQELVLTKNFNLANNKESCEINYSYISTLMAQTTRLKISSTTNITFKSLRLEIFGHNINFYKYDNDLKCSCYNQSIYITKYEDGVVKYGKFSPEEEIDFDNLPYSTNFYDDLCEGYTFRQYMPVPKASGSFGQQSGQIVSEGIDNKWYMTVLEQPIDSTVSNRVLEYNGSGWLNNTNHSRVVGHKIEQDKPCIYSLTIADSVTTYTKLNVQTPWLFLVGVNFNNREIGDSYATMSNGSIIALNADGNFYSASGSLATTAKIIGKGCFATAYAQTTTLYNVYVSNGEKIDKYILKKSGSNFVATYSLTIEDCDCVYETYNNKIIKHIVSTNTWTVDELTY